MSSKPITKATAPPTRGAPSASNTLNLDGAGLNRFLDARGGNEKPGTARNFRRQYVRWPYRVATTRVVFAHPGGSATKLNLACWNLSAGGVGLLHRSYVHKGTRCALWLVDVHGHEVEVRGTVVRCIHMDGSVHDVGVQFDHALQARQFVKLDPFNDGFALEKVSPEALKGTLLYVETSALDHALVRHYLRETQVNLQIAATIEEAIEKATSSVDLIISEFDLGEFTGVELVGCLRSRGITTPIILLTADSSPGTRQLLSKAQADAFLAKPLRPEILYQAIAEMMTAGTGGVMLTSLPPGHPSLGLLPTFVQQVRDYSKALEKAIATQSAVKCRSLCFQIAGAAPVMGFDRLAALAKEAEAAVSTSMNATDATGPMKMLIMACQQVSARLPE